jgi:DsbC/DsbD-like thiol-disulfide interchange protein
VEDARDMYRTLLPALFCLACAASPAAAERAASVGDGVAHVALIDGWRASDGKVVAAITITLAPGWHTYWRNPGDIGMPPDFDWRRSTNLADVVIDWPTPQIFEIAGNRSIGYADSVVLPITLTPRDPSRPIDLALDLSLGVCSEVCVPDEARLTARFGPRAENADPAVIRAALAARPRPAAQAGVAGMTCDLSQGPDGLEMTATITFDRAARPDQMAVIETAQPGLWIGPPEAETEGRVLVARAPIEAGGVAINRGDLRVTLLGAGGGIDIKGCASARQAAAGP